MGSVIFLLLTLTLAWIHINYMRKHSYYTSDRCKCWLFILFMIWVSYYLTLLTMASRHAGKVCAGYYLPKKHQFRAAVEPPYIKSEGLFLWYAMLGQFLFVFTIATGAASYSKS